MIRHVAIIALMVLTVHVSGQVSDLDSVKEKYSLDDNAYKHFLDLGKCHCLDILDNKSSDFFNNHFFTLYDLKYAFPRMFYKEKIKTAINVYYEKNINDIFVSFKEKDEKIKLLFHSPFLFCDKLFEKNDNTRQLYRTLVNDSTSYTGHHYIDYLDDVITNK